MNGAEQNHTFAERHLKSGEVGDCKEDRFSRPNREESENLAGTGVGSPACATSDSSLLTREVGSPREKSLAPSRRHKDINGYLHVEISPLTKETVNPYRGREIPYWDILGLDPEKIYNGYRAGSELQKALNTFNGIPVLDRHKNDSADMPLKDERVGFTGTSAKWEAPYIMNALIITDSKAIELIESNKQRELSASYRYKPVFESGSFNGEKYDFIMTDIQANHIALVEEGRAGSDVLVYDSLGGELRSRSPSQPPQLLGTASARTCRSTAGQNNKIAGEKKMAKNVEELKQTLDAFVTAFQNFLSEEEQEAAHAADSNDSYKDAMEKAGCDSENEVEQKAFAEGVKYGEELIRNNAERKKLNSEHESEGMKKAMDTAGCDSENEAEQKAFAEGVKYGEELIRSNEERKKLDSEHESEGMKKVMHANDTALSKAAFDETIKQAEERGANRAVEQMKSLYNAAADVKKTVSVNPLAYDSASDIYKEALKREGVDFTGVDKSAYQSLYKSIVKNKNAQHYSTPVTAMDGKDENSAFKKNVKVFK